MAAVLREDPERWRAAGRAMRAVRGRRRPARDAARGRRTTPCRTRPSSPATQHGRLLCAIADVLLAPTESAPSVLVFEDVHWADSATLELIERLVRQLATEPVLVLLTMRADVVPAWTSLSYATVVALDRLGAPELELLVRGLLDDAPPPDGLVAAIDERSDGVPLFAEELVLALRDAGTLRRGGGGWELADLRGPLAVPDTLHDLLLARLGQLGPARVVAQVGAVLGRRFDRELLDAVAGLDERRRRRGARPARGRRGPARARTRRERAVRLQARPRPGCGLRVAAALRPAGAARARGARPRGATRRTSSRPNRRSSPATSTPPASTALAATW